MDLELVAPAMQTNYADNYSGTAETFVLTEFTTTPRPICQDRVTYACTGVTLAGSAFSDTILCTGTEDLLGGGL